MLLKKALTFVLVFSGYLCVAQVYYENQKLTAAIANECTGYGFIYYPDDLRSTDQYIIASVEWSGQACDSSSGVTIYETVNNMWELDTVIYPPDSVHTLGRNVFITDDFLCIAAPYDSTLYQNGGSIYIYRNEGDSWNFIQKLYPNNATSNNRFGEIFQVKDDFLFARKFENGTATSTFEIFKWNGSVWQFEQQLLGFQPVSVEVNSDLVVFKGSQLDENFEAIDYIHTYAFENDVLVAKDTLNVGENTFLKYELDEKSNTLMVQHVQNGPDIFNFFAWQNNQWVWQDELLQNSSFAYFALVFEGDFLALSNPNQNLVSTYSGNVELYHRDENGWHFQGQCLTSDLGYWDQIGRRLDISGNSLLVSSNDLMGNYYNGAVQVFRLSGCNDPLACNYLPDGIVENGLCQYPGCDDNTACNYNAETCAGGVCIYPEEGDFSCSGSTDIVDLLLFIGAYGCTSGCDPFDMDGDGVVGIFDLLIFMTLLG